MDASLTNKNHYELLSISPEASLEDVQAAYGKWMARIQRRLKKQDPLPEAVVDAVWTAYRTLIDPASRAAYDATLPTPPARTQDVPVTVFPAADEGCGLSGPVTFEFTGNGGEYFRIWIVNLLLSIVTLGVYSAWAKVRREQYFHRNTLLDGSGFDYHGDPKAILKGRAIGFGLFMLLSITQEINHVVYLICVMLALPVIPWFVVRSFRFRAANTSYRGLRFRFDGSYREALKVYLGFGLLTLVTLGLAGPFWWQRMKAFQLNHLHYGGESFAASFPVKAFYGIALKAALLSLIPVLSLVALAMGTGLLADMQDQQALTMFILDWGPIVFGIFVLAFYLFPLLVIRPYVQTAVHNRVWNDSMLGGHQFVSTQRFVSFLKVVLANSLLIVLTLGLYWPWAKVRLATYRAEHMALEVDGTLDDFVAQARDNPAAIGEEIADVFNFDVAL